MAAPWEQYQQAPSSQDGPWSKYASQTIAVPTEGMSNFEKFAAGVGKSVADVGRTAGRALGIVSPEQVAESKRLDQPLMKTLAGKVGNVGGDILISWPVGGLLGKAAQAVGASPALVQALRTGGMSSGGVGGVSGLAARVAGGAATGGASAGLINPEEAKTGALIGAVLPGVMQAAKAVPFVGKKLLGATTGVGDEAISQAYQSGKAGGEKAKAFAEALRGQSSMDDVLTAAKQNLAEMGAQKQAAYRSGMADIKADKSILDLSGIQNAADDAMQMATFKGQIKNEPAAKAIKEIKGQVEQWSSLDPAEFHTPEGFDALKQRIGGVIESIPFEQKTARAAAGKVYNAVKGEISKQAPSYAGVMKDYSAASETISEIEKALSLGKKASADTGMRKLQSLMRNNVNTSYGYRTDLANQLQQAGGLDLMPALAGQALSELAPRGIQKAATGAGGLGLALTGNIPAAAGMAALSSPRLIGEAAYGAGKVAGAVPQKLIDALNKGAYKTAPILGTQE